MILSTDELLEELSESNFSLDEYMDTYRDSLINPDICAFWSKLVKQSGRSKSDIINKSEINYTYFYDIFNGRKVPTRDKILRLCLAMKAGVENCREALRLEGKSPLYPKIKRDSIVLFALQNNWSVARCAEALTRYGEEELK